MSLLAIDPGRDTGWAVFDGEGYLVRCGLGEPEVWAPRVVVEKPQIYVASKAKGDPNDLITLAIQVGRYAERYEKLGGQVLLVLPAQWKGQLPKDVHHSRIWNELADDERAILEGLDVPMSKKHNVYDAVGLGKWALRRVIESF